MLHTHMKPKNDTKDDNDVITIYTEFTWLEPASSLIKTVTNNFGGIRYFSQHILVGEQKRILELTVKNKIDELIFSL